MMLYELDDIERAVLEDTQPAPVRPGEKVIKWYCLDCDCEHEASVLGGAVQHDSQKEAKQQ